MGLSFTLEGVTFGAGAVTAGTRTGLAFDATPVFTRTRSKPYGCKGQFQNFGDLECYHITAKVRYVDTAPYALYQADRDAFGGTFPGLSIVGQDGKTYTRCTLDPGGSRVVRDMSAIGRAGGIGFIDVEYRFTSDGG